MTTYAEINLSCKYIITADMIMYWTARTFFSQSDHQEWTVIPALLIFQISAFYDPHRTANKGEYVGDFLSFLIFLYYIAH